MFYTCTVIMQETFCVIQFYSRFTRLEGVREKFKSTAGTLKRNNANNKGKTK